MEVGDDIAGLGMRLDARADEVRRGRRRQAIEDREGETWLCGGVQRAGYHRQIVADSRPESTAGGVRWA